MLGCGGLGPPSGGGGGGDGKRRVLKQVFACTRTRGVLYGTVATGARKRPGDVRGDRRNVVRRAGDTRTLIVVRGGRTDGPRLRAEAAALATPGERRAVSSTTDGGGGDAESPHGGRQARGVGNRARETGVYERV